jgi:hypothetical protein
MQVFTQEMQNQEKVDNDQNGVDGELDQKSPKSLGHLFFHRLDEIRFLDLLQCRTVMRISAGAGYNALARLIECHPRSCNLPACPPVRGSNRAFTQNSALWETHPELEASAFQNAR